MIYQSIKQFYDKITIVHIILVSFAIHLFVIGSLPVKSGDEVFFTDIAKWFMMGIDHTPYQLPGLSLIISPFIYVFGDTWFSWRFPIIIFGMMKKI